MGNGEQAFNPGPYYEVTASGEYDINIVLRRGADKAEMQAFFDEVSKQNVSNPNAQVGLYEVVKTPIMLVSNGIVTND